MSTKMQRLDDLDARFNAWSRRQYARLGRFPRLKRVLDRSGEALPVLYLAVALQSAYERTMPQLAFAAAFGLLALQEARRRGKRSVSKTEPAREVAIASRTARELVKT